ncbi:MAG: hypothetical protein COA79_11060 [Planctomycetota bacterium]|nr:MAG: hypothetical protein COA79_11060 [Planctomycetota bacterium]
MKPNANLYILKVILFLLFIFPCTYLLINSQEKEKIKAKNIEIDKKNRIVTIQGSFNITNGIIEFLAASKKTTRDYESLILLDCLPSELVTALETAGFKPCYLNYKNCMNFKLQISWKWKGQDYKRNLKDFISTNHKIKKSDNIAWLFTGSKPINKKIKEDVNGEIIGLQPKIAGIIHINKDFGNPYNEDEQKGFNIKSSLFHKLFNEKKMLKSKDKMQKIPLKLIIQAK